MLINLDFHLWTVHPCRYSIDLNRHSPYEWKPEGGQAGAGPYPMYLPQGRAVYEALVKRNNIATLQSYHTSGAMVLHNGPSVTGSVSFCHAVCCILFQNRFLCERI